MRENSAGVAERVLVASILNVDLDPFRHRVLLDKGAASGVFKGQAVLDAEGIFGQVSQVHARTAEVILISDAEHAIPVQSNRSGLRSIAVGTGDSDRLSLPFVTVESDLKAGDLLISTGMGGVFPSGYPVAEVTRVERNPAATFAVVDARPTARLDRDREVLLVWFDPPVVDTTPPEATAPEMTAPEASGPAASAAAGNAPAATGPVETAPAAAVPVPTAPPPAGPATSAPAATAPGAAATEAPANAPTEAATSDASAPPPEATQ
jgi:rod shape-determining protein MreC